MISIQPLSEVRTLMFSMNAWSRAVCVCLGLLCLSAAYAEEPAAQPAVPAEGNAVEEFIPYARLVDPALQQALGLSEEQKTKLGELLTKRTEAAANATELERESILAQSDAELAAALTDEQRAKFKKLTELKLRFNFRYQKWSEVLEWFAEQAGLSLVIDAPPSGTFNYSDNREYSIPDAIDLLNSVLANKDFTLIRRGRMLMVVDLSGGLPDNLIPRVAVEELNSHGKFELVSVLFPLGKRNAAEVNTEVTPILGPHGTSVALPKTNQLLVTGQVNSILEIQKVIKSIPEPKPPEKKKEPAPAPKPVLQMYDIEGFSPQAASDTLKKLITDLKVVVDTEKSRLSIYAIPAHHETVKSVLEQMKADLNEENKATFETYELNENPDPELDTSLALAVPDAEIRLDLPNQKIIVFATPENQQKIKEALAKLEAGGSAYTKNRQVQVYHLKDINSTAALQLLKQAMPHVRATLDTTQNAVIAIATTEDHRVIKNLMNQLQEGPEEKEVLNTYELTEAPSSTLLSTLQRMTPKATITPEKNRLVVVAMPEDHLKIKETIEKFSSLDNKPTKTLKVYKTNREQQKRFQSISANITAELPGLQVVANSEPDEISVWAEDEQHKLFAEILESLKQEGDQDGEYVINSHELETNNPANVITLLQTLFPGTRILHDGPANRLLIWTSPKEQAEIAAALTKIDAPPRQKQKLEFYTIGDLDSTTVITNLQQLLPTIRLSWDANTEQLLAVAEEKDHQRLAESLEKWKTAKTSRPNKQIEIFSLELADPGSLISILNGLFNQTTFQVSPHTRGIIAIGPHDDMAAIKAVIDQFDAEAPEKNTETLKFYPLERKLPSDFMTLMSQMVPAAKITHDKENNRLTVIAKPKDQEKIVANMSKLLEGTSPVEEKVIRSYHVTAVQRRRFQSLLPTLQSDFPGLQVLAESTPGELSLWAKASQHDEIAKVIEQIKSDIAEGEKPQLLSYKLKVADPNETLNVLQNLFPDTKFVVESRSRAILAWTRPAQQEVLKAAIEQIDNGKPGEFQQNFIILSLQKLNPTIALPILQEAAPGTKVTHDPVANTIIVIGDKESQELVKTALNKLIEESKTAAKANQRTPKVYPGLEGRGGRDLVKLLRDLMPEAKIEGDRDSGTIVAVASEEEHQTIAETLEQFLAVAEKKEDKEAIQLQFKYIGARDARSVIRGMFPFADYTDTNNNKTLIVVARTKDLEAIKKIADSIDVSDQDTTLLIKVYSLESIYASTAGNSLQISMPQLRFTYGADPYKLIVWAEEEQHTQIAEMLKKLDEEASQSSGAEMKVYKLTQVTANIVTPIIQAAVPRARFAPNSNNNRMVIWATSKAHEEIAKIIAQMEEQGPLEEGTTMEVYRLQATNSTSLHPIIQGEVPGARILYSPDPYKMIIHANVAQHEKIKAIVEKLDAEQTATNAGVMKVYKIESIPAHTIQSIINSSMPSVKFGASPDGYKIVTWASTEQHEKIQALLKELEEQAAADSDSELVVYDVSNSGTGQANHIIATSIPGVRIAQSPDPTKIYIWGSKTIHAKVKKIVDILESEETQKKNAIVKFYAVDGIHAGTIQGIVNSAVPNIRFSPSHDGIKTAVWGTEAQHAKVQAVIDELKAAANANGEYEMKVYTLNSTGANFMHSVINNAVPGIRVNLTADPSKMTVWGTTTMHEKVKQIVDKLEAEGPVSKDSFVETYLFNKIPAASAINVLQMSVPQGRYTTTTDTRKLIVWAKPSDHKAIKAIVSKLDQDLGVEDARDLAVVPLKGVSFSTLLEFMKPELKVNANFTPNTATDNLIVQAPQDRMELLVAEINSLIEKLPKDEKPISRAYDFKYGDPGAAHGILQALVPTARIAVDHRARKIVVTAVPDDHKKIAEAVAELDVKESDENAPGLKKYVLKNVDPYNMQGMLQTLFASRPEVRFSVDINTKTLVAYAKPDQQKEIATFVADVDQAGSGSSSKVFKLKNIDPHNTANVIRGMLPRNPVIPDTLTKTLTVVGTETDHAKVAKTLEQLDQDETAAVSKVYNLQNINANTASNIVRGILPRNPVIPDQSSRTLTVVGTPDEQVKVAATIQQIDHDNSNQISKVYSLKNADPFSAMNIIRGMFPQNVIVPDRASRTLSVVASEAEHLKITTTIQQLDEENSSQISRVFNLKHINPNSAYNIIARLIPRATVVADPATKTLTVVGNELEHAKAEETLTQIDQKNVANDRIMKSYTVQSIDPSVLNSMLNNLFNRRPDTNFSFDRVGGTVIANAPPEVHDEIALAIAEIEKSGGSFSTRAFHSKKIAPGSLQQMLRSQFPNQVGVRITFDQQSGMVMAYGPTPKLDKIQAAIEELEKSMVAKTSQVYRLEESDSRSALNIMRTLVPNAVAAADTRSNSLIVEATPEDHQIIANLVQQMEQSDPQQSNTKTSRAYQVSGISTNGLFQMVRDIFRDDFGVKISRDNQSETVVVRAKPGDHEKVANLIAELEKKASSKETRIYRLDNADPESARRALREATPKATVAIDDNNNSLIVTASTKDQEQIDKLIEELDFDINKDRILEVFQLQANDAFTAEMAIENMFGNSVWDDKPTSPLIDSDMNSQQLYIKATEDKLKQIRELLVKMGETHLADATTQQQKGKFRVIPFRGNSKEALQEIERIWPQLRKNQIKMVVPSAVAPTLRKFRKPADGGSNFSVEDKVEPAQEEQNEPVKETAPPKEAAEVSAEEKPSVKEGTVQEELPPVIVSIKDDQIMISSDDTEALDQLETLLRAFTRDSKPQSKFGREFVVFELHNASAREVAQTLKRVFGQNNRRQNNGRSRLSNISQLSIESDERLNAVIVYGNQKERETIEELLQVLDIEENSELLEQNRPKVVPVVNTSASKIESVLQNVYRAEMRSAGGARPIPVPSGVSREVAATIQQINVTMAGPLLQISIDDQTNSLILSGSKKILEQVESLIAELDERAKTDSTQTFKVVPLKKINSSRAREVLRELFPQNSRGGNRGRNNNRRRNR